MPETDNLFNVLLHFATLIAVFVYYWSDIWEMITEFFLGIRALFVPQYRSQGEPPAARRLILLIIVATLPLFLVLPIKDYVEQIGNYPAAVSCILLLTGAVLFLSDRMAHGHKTARSATLKDALLIGVAQSVATLPGLSRSGSTIAAGMACGLDRKFAVRFSFLMSLPAVLGATILKAVGRGPGGGRGSVSPAQVSAGHGLRRRGGVFLHRPGESSDRQGEVRRLCLLLLGCGRALPGAEPDRLHPGPRGLIRSGPTGGPVIFPGKGQEFMATTQKKKGGSRAASSGGRRTASSSSSSRSRSSTSGSRKKQPPQPAHQPFRREIGAVACLLLALFSALGYFHIEALFIDFFCGLVKG